MRLDRLITLTTVQPLRRALSAVDFRHSAFEVPIPILMYHSISDDTEFGMHSYYKTCTSPSVFRQQMRFLADNGYRTISLEDATRTLRSIDSRPSTPPPAQRPVVLTFDDAFQDFRTHALPILKEFNFTATVFAPTAFIGERRRAFHPVVASNSRSSASISATRSCLTWRELQELRDAGMEIGSHTVNHPRLAGLTWSEIRSELQNSKSELEQRLDRLITTFAYPYAFPQEDASFIKGFKRILDQEGYECCVTTCIGTTRPGDDPWCLKRLPVNSDDDPLLFGSKLHGSYDWLGLPQSMVKSLKRKMSRSHRNGLVSE